MDLLSTLLDEAGRHLSGNGESRRLFYGRGQCFAGLDDVVVDYHPGLILICLYRHRDTAWLEMLAARLRELVPTARGVVVQLRHEE